MIRRVMRLLIGNKNYSSWSLRIWLLMRELGLPFEEEKLSFSDPGWKRRVLEVSPAGQLPVLIDRGVAVWDTMAIIEYLAERFPDAGVWPSDVFARAVARSVSAEMHSGFLNVRRQMPMNIEARLPGLGWNILVQGEIDRISAIWEDSRSRFGAGGPMLFGAFSAADAFFAPVVWRFVTHDVPLSGAAKTYAESVRALPSLRVWEEEALEERDFVVEDEPYRRPPTSE